MPNLYKGEAISPHRPIVAISNYSYERACGGTGDSKNSSLTLWNLQTGQLVTTLFRRLAGEAFSFKENFEPQAGSSSMLSDFTHAIADGVLKFSPDGKISLRKITLIALLLTLLIDSSPF